MEDSKIIHLLQEDSLNKALFKLYKHQKPIQKFILSNSDTREDFEDIFWDCTVIVRKKI